MSQPQNPFVPDGSITAKVKNETTPKVSSLVLRWWPAALLVVVMAGTKFSSLAFESVSIEVMMVGFMGPAVVAVLVLCWWLFASRAGLREKLMGLVGLIVIGGITMSLVDKSLVGMTSIFQQFPSGIALFALALCVMAAKVRERLPAALICAAVGFGVWDFLRMDGVTGKFDPELAWRWSPTAEDAYLKSLAGGGAAADPAASEESITRASAESPDFRGANRDGRYSGVVLMDDWKTTPPIVKWKTLVGPGWSSFSVAGRRLFTQEQRGDNEAVVCMDADSGSVLWVHEYASRFWESVAGAGPRATPTIGDDGLYCLGANGELMCLNAATGKLIWERKLQTEAGRTPPMWGFSSSPLLTNDMVIVHAGGPADKGVLAFDSKTGEPRWSVASGDHGYSSPQLATLAGTDGILMSTNWGLQFLDARTGNLLWNEEWKTDNYRATQPLVSGDVILYSTSLGMGTRRLTVTQEAGSWKVVADWTTKDMKPDFNDFVEYDGRIYGFDSNIFACLDAETGERLWKRGRYGNGQVLLVADAGQLLVISEYGELILIKADPKQLVELSKFQAIEGKTWNHPVLVGNRLYVRNGQEAACLELPLRPAESTAPAQQL